MSEAAEVPVHPDCELNCGEADSEASNETAESNNNDSIDGSVEEQKLKEAELISQSRFKSAEECLATVENLEKTCSELHDKCKLQQDNLDKVTKQCGKAVKEKELMVMRYAVGEKTVLDLKLFKENAQKKEKELLRENEILQHKLSTMASEKSRICQMLDNKVYDLKCNVQELEKVKLDLSALETKLKWSQNSLKVEKDLRKDSDANAESLRLKLQEYVNEVEQAKREAQETIKNFYVSQENRANILEKQLNELQASLILIRHEKDDKDKQLKLLQTELLELQCKEKGASYENSTTLAKLQILQKEHLEITNRFNEMQNNEEQLKQCQMELNLLTCELQQIRAEKVESVEQIDFITQHKSDLETDLKTCRERESELLLYTQQITNKNVQLLSEFSALETKVHQLKCEQDLLKRTAADYEAKVDLLTKQLVNDRCKFAAENSNLAKELEAKTKLCEALSQDVSDQQGENCIIKRKLELSLKEVSKELQQCRKKIDQYETASQSSNSSSSSLNAIDQANNLLAPYSDGDQVKVIQPELTIDKKALVEHIVKLQRISARKSEKIDFLEEHINTLVSELQRKTHLLQSYIIREQTGTMTSNKMDKNKANIAKLNGIMASVYGSRVADNNLTLELSLDINRKLQAVLEDALLKNITLKENIDTLGVEIDRLNNLLKPYSNTVDT